MAERRRLPAFAIGQPLRGPPAPSSARPTGAQTFQHQPPYPPADLHPQSEVGLTYEDDPEKLESDLMSFNDEFTDYFKNRHTNIKTAPAEKADMPPPLQSLPAQLVASRHKEVNIVCSSRDQTNCNCNFMLKCILYSSLCVMRVAA